ncbi:MAG: WYL domain-containing protein [Bacteroidales bacterium]|nr:WYL domain-containing protein [Bacteroidales bacterium]
MAKQDYIFRYLTIIKKLRRNGEATFQEINDYLKKESEFLDRTFSVSNRTFMRDLNEIRTLFKIDIRYDFSKGVYFIAEDQQSDLNNRMLESIDTINSLKMVSDITRYMFFEKRKAHGTHHFYGLLHAIKNRVILMLVHKRFDSDEPKERLVEPFALKESKGRWYLLAKDRNDRKVKTFGLDRILDFQTTPGCFDYPVNLDVNEMFRYCFGVINPDDDQPEEIILSFEPDQGKYVKSYPIHESQVILEDNPQELRIKITLFITHDLVMEILSYGKAVKVVSPERLISEVRTIYTGAEAQYGDE